MKVYFYSEILCYVKIDCNYVGIVDKNYNYLTLFGNELIEFTPKNHAYLPYATTLDGEKDNLIKFYDGYLFVPKFVKVRNLPYKLILQKCYHDKFTLTVVTDGAIKFYLEGVFNATDELPFLPVDIDFKIVNNYVFIIFKNKKHAIFVYDIHGTLCFKNIADNYEIDKELKISIFNGDFCPLNYNVYYTFDTPFSVTKTEIISYETTNFFTPYMFLTLLKNGVSIKDFLTNDLILRENELKDFIGNFTTVLLPLNNEVGKVLCLNNNEIKHLKFVILNDKITNIFIDD